MGADEQLPIHAAWPTAESYTAFSAARVVKMMVEMIRQEKHRQHGAFAASQGSAMADYPPGRWLEA